MSVSLRRGRAADATTLGEICYSAFKSIAEAHNFPPDFPSPNAAAALLAGLIKHDGFFDVVAELDRTQPNSGVGPVTVAPALQNSGAGRALMQAVLRRSEERGFTGIRLLHRTPPPPGPVAPFNAPPESVMP
jgi:GNAT superfamily N-acetyltransferase